MHTNKDDQTYMESIRTVVETVLRYSDSDKKVEKLTGDPWEVEKCFKMMLSMAGFISFKLAKMTMKLLLLMNLLPILSQHVIIVLMN